MGFPGGSEVKEFTCNEEDVGLIPGSGRSPGEGNGNPLQYSCLENPMDGGAWQATVHGVTKNRTRLSDFTFSYFVNKATDEVNLFDILNILSILLSPCLFNLYTEYIMKNAVLDELQAGTKIMGRNINNSDMQMIPL